MSDILTLFTLVTHATLKSIESIEQLSILAVLPGTHSVEPHHNEDYDDQDHDEERGHTDANDDLISLWQASSALHWRLPVLQQAEVKGHVGNFHLNTKQFH